MCSTDEVQVVAVEELADHISPKGEGDAPIIFTPALDIFVWIRPQQVAEQAWNVAHLSQQRSRVEQLPTDKCLFL